MRNHDPEFAKLSWQSAGAAGEPPSLPDVRRAADRFHRTIRRRNLVEYGAGAVVTVCFTAYVFVLDHVLHRAGSALVVLGTFFALWQLHRRASAEAPDAAGTVPILDFSRSQLVRQRDALSGIFWWYILPLLPGLALVKAGSVLSRPGGQPAMADWISLTVVLLVFGGLTWLNKRGARRLQREIDAIDALKRAAE
jgi:hypothetical protein